MSLSRMAHGLGGGVEAQARRGVFTSVSTDTRALKRGEVFLALKGERFDGHDFLKQALRQGAGALIAENFPAALASRALKAGAGLVRVPDSQAALQALARDQRGLFHGAVAGITGSNGKTGTKNCLVRLLQPFGRVLATQGNFNNHIGLPLTLLRAEPGQAYGVLEMGMNHAGELTLLASIARPSLALVTNVGDAHLGYFKTRRAIARAKSELVRALGNGGLAVLNGDDPLVRPMARLHGGRFLFFGRSAGCDLRAARVEDRGLSGLRAEVEWRGRRRSMNLKQGGKPSFWNCLGALAAGLALRLPFEGLLAGLEAYRPEGAQRLETRRLGRATAILDCYNASPQSMQAALEVLQATAPAGRRLAVLGDMLELGSASARLHAQVGRLARRAGVRALAAVGPHAGLVCRAFGAESAAFAAGEQASAAAWLRKKVLDRDWILFKGSHGMHIEKVYEAF